MIKVIKKSFEEALPMLGRLFKTDANWVVTIVRVVLGVVFFAHGAQKMLGWYGGYGFSGTMGWFTKTLGIPAPLAFLAICAEFFGGLGLILGLLSRIAALGIGVNMVVAIAMVHSHFGFFANWSAAQKGEGYEFHLLVLAIVLAIIVRGAGALSADRAIHGWLAGGSPEGERVK
jgi:putative oxidoreductase